MTVKLTGTKSYIKGNMEGVTVAKDAVGKSTPGVPGSAPIVVRVEFETIRMCGHVSTVNTILEAGRTLLFYKWIFITFSITIFIDAYVRIS